MHIVLDSCALLAYLLDETEADQMERLLLEAGKKKHLLFLSVLQYGEVLYTCENLKGETYRLRAQEFLSKAPISIIPANQEQANLAAAFKARGGIAYPDCFALALATLRKATLVTKDREFRKFAKDVKIRWL